MMYVTQGSTKLHNPFETKKNPAELALPRVFLNAYSLAGYQANLLKPSRPIPSISRAIMARPYWLRVGIPSKNIELTIVH